MILKKRLSQGISFTDFLIQSLPSMYQRVIKFDVVVGDLESPFSSCILEKKFSCSLNYFEKPKKKYVKRLLSHLSLIDTVNR